MPRVRPRSNGEDDVVMQRKAAFLPRKWKIAWYDYSSLRNRLHRIEEKLSKHMDEAEKLCQEWAAEKANLEAEIKAVKANRYNNLGVGDDFYITEKELRKWVGGTSFVPRPDESWKGKLGQQLLFRYGIVTKAGKRTHIKGAVLEKKGPASGQTTYTLGEHHNLLIEGGNQVIGFKEEKRGGNNQQHNGVSKNRMKQLRNDYPREPGESDQEWNNRLQAVARNGDDTD